MFKVESVLAVVDIYKPWIKVIETYNIPVDANIQMGFVITSKFRLLVSETPLGNPDRPNLYNSLAGMQARSISVCLMPECC